MKHLKFVLFNLLLLTLFGCKENELVPQRNDGIPPGPVSNVKIEPLPGAAILTYDLPEDKDLLYVRAQYVSKNGALREFKASYFDTQIKVEGFGDTDEYEVQLFAVDEGENQSVPETVLVSPERPPYLNVLDSLEIIADFGGVNISFVNEDQGSIAIVTLANDTIGNFVPFNTFYTKLREGNFSVRGFDSIETKFGFYIRDRWNNISDTLIIELTPYFEMQLDKAKMTSIALPNDAPLGYGGQVNYLFDGNKTDNGKKYYHTGDAAVMPQWFTFDLGGVVKISRMAWWMRGTDDNSFFFALHNPREIEIWGSNNPASDGSWDSWILLTSYIQEKPSGLPLGELSQDDLAAAEAGETFNFPIDAPAVRYVRFKTLRNWSNGTYVNFDELSIWGQPE